MVIIVSVSQCSEKRSKNIRIRTPLFDIIIIIIKWVRL